MIVDIGILLKKNFEKNFEFFFEKKNNFFLLFYKDHLYIYGGQIRLKLCYYRLLLQHYLDSKQ